MINLGGAVWRKSTRSGSTGGNCVEMAETPDAIGVRDSKDASGPILTFDTDAWRGFLAEVKAGKFNR
jgi:hypothetical protein